ncbi:hypothetical protein BCR34DRAFT_367148 [Clohesyomyces aquaticus]|uniref:Uncharacterized protein n=1 Tax=Clohesyomyces aquaticus TaxID=1231657 RepID=A0A1Y1ZHC7_9PLEO|nr:hypothetical protein BCR34DRAFT_367148 [Clohesyomyces aquaticus]
MPWNFILTRQILAGEPTCQPTKPTVDRTPSELMTDTHARTHTAAWWASPPSAASIKSPLKLYVVWIPRNAMVELDQALQIIALLSSSAQNRSTVVVRLQAPRPVSTQDPENRSDLMARHATVAGLKTSAATSQDAESAGHRALMACNGMFIHPNFKMVGHNADGIQNSIVCSATNSPTPGRRHRGRQRCRARKQTQANQPASSMQSQPRDKIEPTPHPNLTTLLFKDLVRNSRTRGDVKRSGFFGSCSRGVWRFLLRVVQFHGVHGVASVLQARCGLVGILHSVNDVFLDNGRCEESVR